MEFIPIIFVHKGNPYYLKHALEQARIFNPNSNICLLGDDTNKHFKEVEHYHYVDFFESAAKFQKKYIHQSPNPYEYELFRFQRWFIIKDFIKEQGISHFLYLDSDVLLYCNVDEVFNEYLDLDFTICDKAPCSTLFNKEALSEFCDFIQELYTNEFYLDILERRYNEFINNQRVTGNSDMTAFELIQKHKTPKVKELTIINNRTCFDGNINIAGDFVEEKGRKKIFWMENDPYAKLRKSQSYILFHTLHFDGWAKHVMHHYRINSKYRHTNGIFYKIKSVFSIKLIINTIKQTFIDEKEDVITKLYRKLVPKKLRGKIYEAFLGDFLIFVRNLPESIKSIYIYLFRKFLPDTETNRFYAFMGRHGLSFHPYQFNSEYKKLRINYFWDRNFKMYYFLYEGKKVYYPQNFNKNARNLVANYRSLLIEQDIRSPHRYVKYYDRLSGKTVLDVGATGGIFSLNVIEKVNHVYLFECDENWIKALEATFAPWQEKVTIIPKYVSGTNDKSHITIDRFLEGKDKNNLFLKMNIEGAEQSALKGAEETLKEAKDLDYAICTYHCNNAAVEIENLLKTNHFESEFSEGFLYIEKTFRKAIIRRSYNSEELT